MARTKTRVRVLVVGGGPAGLAAAARLLERGGRERFHVRLVTMGHHLGGKASSWRDGAGRLVDHGQHVIVGWYREMKGLIGRAGVDVEARLVPNEGHTFVWEERDRTVHDLALKRNPLRVLASSLGYTGLTRKEKASITRFVLGSAGAFLGTQDIEQWDDVCFTAFCLSNGLAPSIASTNAFRMSRTAQLNWPGEISAYSMLKSIRRIGRDYRTSAYSFCDGGMSERFWEPIAAHIARLGGEVDLLRKLVRIEHAGGRAVGAVLAEPDPAGHDDPARSPHGSRFEGAVPSRPGTEEADRDFDHLVCTLPATAFQELNPGDDAFWRMEAFAGIRRLRGVAPLALQIWHRHPLTRRYPSVVAGLDGPLGFVLDNKPIVREYREDPRYGSVLYFVGQETGYEDWSDTDHLDRCLANVVPLPGFERIDRAGILHWQLVRHRSPSTAYFYTEPGVQKHRPHTRTPLANLWLAGDWVRSEVDFPCMEAAVRSGMAAADEILRCGS